MRKKYIVRLTDAERETLERIVGKLKGSSQKVRRANILLKADADGPAWTDARIAAEFVAGMEEVLDAYGAPYDGSLRCCAWTSSRCNC
jgi:hypothetical protein